MTMNPGDLPAFLANYRGGVSVEEGVALCRYAADCVGGDVVEIGSFRGKSAVALATGAALSGVQVYCIEPHAEFTGVYGGKFGPQDRGAFYQVMLQTGLFDRVALVNLPSRDAARAFRRPIGLLFIDGDHRYPGVRSDFEAWDPYVGLGGIVAFDDATDPAVGPAHLIVEILAAGRYVPVESVGKVRFFRKISSAGAIRGADRKRILVACHDLALAGGLFRFERFGRIARARGHEVAFLRFADPTPPSRAIDFPILGWQEACSRNWDVTMVPGAGFPAETLERFDQLTQPQFGLRMQHVLNDQTLKAAFIQVNQAFKPHVVVFNNQEWPPGSYTRLQARRFHVIEGGVDAAAFAPQGRSARPRCGPFVVGGLMSKNSAPLLQALRDLEGGFELRLFGEPGDLAQTAQDLVRSGALKLMGPLSEQELPAFYADLDCVVHSETFAGWANLAAEALASGIPLICTRHGTRAFAVHGETALVLGEPTPEALGASIQQLQADQALRANLAKNGRERIKQYSWESYTTRLLDLMDAADSSTHYSWAPELGLYGKWPLPVRLQGLKPLLDTCAGQTLLDLGAADGLIARTFLEHGAAHLYGVDQDAARVAGARAICHAFLGAHFWPMDISDWERFLGALAVKVNGPFDTVLSLGVHQHLPPERRLACLSGAAALARAHFVIRTPEHLFHQDGITALLTGLGFDLEYTAPDAMQAEMGPLRCYRRRLQP
jgi:predicted O-methyltransferase YrrM/2-polyprenyl-3-methyl-5-hydroxy-6-metoxy-1,4-benzoquinol methylase